MFPFIFSGPKLQSTLVRSYRQKFVSHWRRLRRALANKQRDQVTQALQQRAAEELAGSCRFPLPAPGARAVHKPASIRLDEHLQHRPIQILRWPG